MCAIVGVHKHPEAAKMTYLALYALQHRGQESTGIVSSHEEFKYQQKGMGLVRDFFTEDRFRRLPGDIAIGHNRYSTSGSSIEANAQPILRETTAFGDIAVAHNGNITNSDTLKESLKQSGYKFSTTSDTEVILPLIDKWGGFDFISSLRKGLSEVQGAYSLVFLYKNTLIAVRDPYGFRPLILGKFPENQGYIIASETCAFDLVGASYVREIEPGEIVYIQDNKIHSDRLLTTVSSHAKCVFEVVYFARPDSSIFSTNVHKTRQEFGRQLAREHPINADVVIPVPDSGMSSALGYSYQSGIPFDMGFTRNHYIGRTFIEPEQQIRNFGVKLKLNPNRNVLFGKRVIVVDDSLVRGTTSKKIVDMLLEIGAREVHMRISCPPTRHPCVYGIDTPTEQELIANSFTVSEICKYIGANTLGYLSLEGMMRIVNNRGQNSFCNACFTGCYLTKKE